MKIRLLFTVLFIIFNFSIRVTAQPKNDFTNVSSDVNYQYIGTYEISRLDSILTGEASAFSDFNVIYPNAIYPVKLYRVLYNSIIPEFNNKPAVASGLIADNTDFTDIRGS